MEQASSLVFLARVFQKHKFGGLDVSPVPTHVRANRPENVRFLQDNITTDKPGPWFRPGEVMFSFGQCSSQIE